MSIDVVVILVLIAFIVGLLTGLILSRPTYLR